jgi:hypothetical protein
MDCHGFRLPLGDRATTATGSLSPMAVLVGVTLQRVAKTPPPDASSGLVRPSHAM